MTTLRIPGLVMNHWLGSGWWQETHIRAVAEAAKSYTSRRVGRHGWVAIYENPPGWLVDRLEYTAGLLLDVCNFGSGSSAERRAANQALDRIEALREEWANTPGPKDANGKPIDASIFAGDTS